jgi:hypothetical protein
MIRSS